MCFTKYLFNFTFKKRKIKGSIHYKITLVSLICKSLLNYKQRGNENSKISLSVIKERFGAKGTTHKAMITQSTVQASIEILPAFTKMKKLQFLYPFLFYSNPFTNITFCSLQF